MGSTNINENGIHERGYSRGFCPYPHVNFLGAPSLGVKNSYEYIFHFDAQLFISAQIHMFREWKPKKNQKEQNYD